VPVSEPVISCRNVWKLFGPSPEAYLGGLKGDPGFEVIRQAGYISAVRDVSLDIARGEMLVIMGLSGSGKSTLVRCLSRLIEITGGTVSVEGQDIGALSETQLIELRRNKMGMVFQSFGLLPHRTVLENVAFPLEMRGQNRATRRKRALEVIELVGLGGREDYFPRELSGGQQQRVGIARSLAIEPDIWFLDEPFSALDPLIRRQLQDEFLQIQAKLKTTILFITHDITEALKLADRIAIMRDGRIVQIGTPTQILLNPVDDYVREFSRDVPKGRHARVRSVMHPAADHPPGPDDPGLRTDMTLDEALARCMDLYQPVPVHDSNGATVGTVNPADLAAALQVERR
jgi:glycine betaine/proline transport system ATP-binding protein